MSENKFEFDTDFQEQLLRYTIKDKNGLKALQLYSETYFTLNEHYLIALALKRFFKTYQRVPKESSLLKDEFNNLMRDRNYAELLTREEKTNAISVISSLYREELKDGDIVFEKCLNFIRYTELKNTLENVNLLNYKDYDRFLEKVQKAIKHGSNIVEKHGTRLIRDIKKRQFERQHNPSVIPTPFRQINKATNAGGYDKNSIIVVLDRPKKFKTGMLINIIRGYLRLKKKILVIDLENGEDSYSIRIEQSLTRKSKAQVLSGKFDNTIQKILRKYKRLGGEVVIIRLPKTSTSNDIAAEMDYYYQEHGIRFDELIIDYAALMNSLSGKTDDHNRIADVYLDLSDLAVKYDIEHIWTAHHVKKEAYSKEETAYDEGDLAKCIEIGRHVHAIWGLNRDKDEEENKIMRMELVVQRDGLPNAKALFHIDYETQRADEFTIEQVKEYMEFLEINQKDDERKSIKKQEPKKERVKDL